MSENDSRYDSTVSGNNTSDSGMLYVPAQAQRDLGLAIDDAVEVTLSDIDHEFIDSVSFEGVQTAGDCVTVPARIMRQAGIDGGDSVTAEFDTPEDEADDDPSDLGASQGAVESEEEESDGLGELFSTDDETEESEPEEESEGLGELFG